MKLLEIGRSRKPKFDSQPAWEELNAKFSGAETTEWKVTEVAVSSVKSWRDMFGAQHMAVTASITFARHRSLSLAKEMAATPATEDKEVKFILDLFEKSARKQIEKQLGPTSIKATKSENLGTDPIEFWVDYKL